MKIILGKFIVVTLWTSTTILLLIRLFFDISWQWPLFLLAVTCIATFFTIKKPKTDYYGGLFKGIRNFSPEIHYSSEAYGFTLALSRTDKKLVIIREGLDVTKGSKKMQTPIEVDFSNLEESRLVANGNILDKIVFKNNELEDYSLQDLDDNLPEKVYSVKLLIFHTKEEEIIREELVFLKKRDYANQGGVEYQEGFSMAIYWQSLVKKIIKLRADFEKDKDLEEELDLMIQERQKGIYVLSQEDEQRLKITEKELEKRKEEKKKEEDVLKAKEAEKELKLWQEQEKKKQEKESFKAVIDKKAEDIVKDKEIISLIRAFLEETPGNILVNSKNFITFEKMILHNNYIGEMALISKKEDISSANYQNQVLVQQFKKDYFDNLVRRVFERKNFNTIVECVFTTWNVLYREAIIFYERQLRELFPEDFAEIKNITWGESISIFCLLDISAEERMSYIGYLTYFLIHHNVMPVSSLSFISCYRQVRNAVLEELLRIKSTQIV